MANFSDVKQDECIKKAIPAGVKLGASRTLVMQSVINDIKAHGRSSMNREICGVLVGNLCWDDDAYLLIDTRIEGKFAIHQAGSVTFTSETWNYIHSELSEKYPDKKIVGWYHTHPGFGIFLSNMDFFIHENFFGIKWQPAYVFDPQAETEGFFFWNENNLEQEKVSVIQDEPSIEKNASTQTGEKISVLLTDDDEKRQNKNRLSYAIIAVLFIMILFASGLTILLMYRHNCELGKELEATQKNQQEKKQQLHEKEQKLRENLQHQKKRSQQELDSKSKEHKDKVEEHKIKIEGQHVIIIKLQADIAELQKKQSGSLKTVQNLQRQLAATEKERKMLKTQLAQAQLIQYPPEPTIISPNPTGSVTPKHYDPKSSAVKNKQERWYQYLWPGNWF